MRFAPYGMRWVTLPRVLQSLLLLMNRVNPKAWPPIAFLLYRWSQHWFLGVLGRSHDYLNYFDIPTILRWTFYTVVSSPYLNFFAGPEENKFDRISWYPGMNGVPLLNDCASVFQCEMEHRYPGGDHTILVGRVLDFSSIPMAPLIFHCGQYQALK